MLFDLRGRGRRRTVQVIYLGLALLMGGGLVLFGVGAGNGNGGLLNAFNGGSSSAQKTVDQPGGEAARCGRRSSTRTTRPAGPRWSRPAGPPPSRRAPRRPPGVTYTAQGKTRADRRHPGLAALRRRLTKSPDSTVAILAARAYQALGNYSGAASAWEIESAASPSEVKGYECLAANAYAAKQTRKGDLAAAKAASLTPKAQRADAERRARRRRRRTRRSRRAAEPSRRAGVPVDGSAPPAGLANIVRRPGPLAQLVEQGTLNPKVGGSIPPRPT